MYYVKYLFVFFSFILLFSCKTDTASNAVGELEKKVAENASPEAIQQLMETYRANLTAKPNAAAANSITIGKIADLQIKNNKIPEAIQTLKDGVKNYYSAPNTAENVWTLGNVYQDKLGDAITAKAIHKIYKENFPSGTHIATANKSLTGDTTSLTEHIDAIGSKMYNEETHRLDTKVANSFIQVCELYALLKPEDSQSPNYLHKAGETARAIRAFPQAIAIYDRIYASYPDFEKAPQALFLKAFTYDNDLKEFDKARALYTEFLKKYPKDDFADDTEFLLGNLGKNDEDIIQGFNKNGKEDNNIKKDEGVKKDKNVKKDK